MNGQTLRTAFVSLPAGAQAVYNSSGLSYYRHPDWLGSSRLATTTTRTRKYDVAYAPYGEPYAANGNIDLMFTGQNQDTETSTVPGGQGGLYDFLFREQAPVQGRWLSPDPAGFSAANLADPQSWNRYAYVANRPLSYVDPLGLSDCVGEEACAKENPNVEVVTASADDLEPSVEDYHTNGCSIFSMFCAADFIPVVVVTKPPEAVNTATISAYRRSVGECLWQATVDAGEDLLGISMIPGTNQDNWEWSSAKFGFVYTGAAEDESLLGLSNGVDAVEKTADFVRGTPAAQAEIRQLLKNQGVKLSLKRVSQDADLLGKWAGRAGKVLAAKSAYDRYQKCRGNSGIRNAENTEE